MNVCDFFLLVACGIRQERMLAIVFAIAGIGALVLLVVVCIVRAFNRAKIQKQIESNNQLEYKRWHQLVSSSGIIRPVNSPLMLSKGETCLWVEKLVTLFEVRSVRHSNHIFGSVPIGKSGLRIGKSFGTSESTDEWRPIAEGQLYITNKQIYFDGDKQDRKIPIGQIATLKADWTAIEVSSDTRQKSMIFMGVNGRICQEIVQSVRRG